MGIDAVSAGLQKCLGGPSGSAPLTVSPKAVAVLNQRRSVEAASATRRRGVRRPIRSNYSTSHDPRLRGTASAQPPHRGSVDALPRTSVARILLEEGRDAVIARHELAGRAMTTGVEALGLECSGDVAHKDAQRRRGLDPVLRAGRAPYGRRCSRTTASRSAPPSGPCTARSGGSGTMGYNARKDTVVTTLAALEHALRRAGHAVPQGGGVRRRARRLRGCTRRVSA